MSTKDSEEKKNRNNASKILLITGLCFVFFGIVLFAVIFYPVFLMELEYRIKTPDPYSLVVATEEEKTDENTIVVRDKDFGIVIPKIGANASVVKDVDPYRKEIYMAALDSGVAHAAGTPYPPSAGNTFFFAHSAMNLYESNRHNVHFYLLDRLEPEDKIFLFYDGNKYVYTVTEKKRVDRTEVEYLTDQDQNNSTITLMTCWPAGTDFLRSIVIAKLAENQNAID